MFTCFSFLSRNIALSFYVHFFIRECVEDGRIRVPFVSTTDNMADFFTKPLPSKHFFRMRDEIMNVPNSPTESFTEQLMGAEDKYAAAAIADRAAHGDS